MAHDHEIGAADRPWKPPTSPDLLDDGLLYMPAQDADTEAQERARARRAAARGDVAAGAEVLDALGLEAA